MMKHSSRQFGDQFSGFGRQGEKISRIVACIIFKIYWLHEWKFKCNSRSKITPDDVHIFFYSPQLL